MKPMVAESWGPWTGEQEKMSTTRDESSRFGYLSSNVIRMINIKTLTNPTSFPQTSKIPRKRGWYVSSIPE